MSAEETLNLIAKQWRTLENIMKLRHQGKEKNKRKTKKTEIVYHDLDIFSLKQIKELTSYDAVFLSNIHEYVQPSNIDNLYSNCGVSIYRKKIDKRKKMQVYIKS